MSLIPLGYAQYQYKDESTTTAEDHDGVWEGGEFIAMATAGLLWQQQTEIMDLKEELMSDTIDDVIGEADEDKERLVKFCLIWLTPECWLTFGLVWILLKIVRCTHTHLQPPLLPDYQLLYIITVLWLGLYQTFQIFCHSLKIMIFIAK